MAACCMPGQSWVVNGSVHTHRWIGPWGPRCEVHMSYGHSSWVGISRQRNSGYRSSRVNIMAWGLSTPDPSLSPTQLSIRRGRATTTHYTHHQVKPDGVAQHYTSPFPGVVHWASLWGRPQCWHAKGACATPNKKERKKWLLLIFITKL